MQTVNLITHHAAADAGGDSHSQPREDRPPRRGWLDPLLLTTAPHLAALAFVLPCLLDSQTDHVPAGLRIGYAVVIITSSVLSLAWHRHRESTASRLFRLDYGFAVVWAAYDMLLAAWTSPSALGLVALLNALSFAANKACEWAARPQPQPASASESALIKLQPAQPRLASYELLHSCWHLLNVCKCIAVAYIVGCTSMWCASCTS